jgi:hypothetical protein
VSSDHWHSPAERLDRRWLIAVTYITVTCPAALEIFIHWTQRTLLWRTSEGRVYNVYKMEHFPLTNSRLYFIFYQFFFFRFKKRSRFTFSGALLTSYICLYPTVLPSGINDINISEVKLGIEKIQLAGYFIEPEERNHKIKILKQFKPLEKLMQSNSVITSWKGLNILCRYKRVSF